ncbi:MAG: GNAT family N-acetyltransferase [Clostridiales bacterium]|nr:GNAT family N-acetyltransferase [Clostridiales bacterium]
MLIRRAENMDIPKIHDLLSQVCLVHHNGRPDLFKYGARKYTDDALAEMISDDEKPIFVAVDDENEVLGYAFCIFEQHINNNILTDVKTLYIDDLCVDEKLRGQHIGKQLYDYVVSFAKQSGCYNLTLNVWNCNQSAMKFYESCGLKPQKTHLETVF